MEEQYESLVAPIAAHVSEGDKKELIAKCNALVEGFRMDIQRLMPLLLDGGEVADAYIQELATAKAVLEEEIRGTKPTKDEIAAEFTGVKMDYSGVKANFYTRQGDSIQRGSPLRRKLSDFVSVHATCRTYAGVIVQKLQQKQMDESDFDLAPEVEFRDPENKE